MLLESYSMEVSRPKCSPSAEFVQCIAELEQDIGEAIPYINAELGGHSCIKDPPSVMIVFAGKYITITSRRFAISGLADTEDAEKVLFWLKTEINEIWERRNEIEPVFEIPEKPQVMDILKKLPRTNCGECGSPTCMAFAAALREETIPESACPYL